MPLTGQQKRDYQRDWIARRRADYFRDKVCVDCGSHDRLELDHVDRKVKVSHRIWSWSAERRAAELVKCEVRCLDCHEKKSAVHGDRGKLTRVQAEELRSLYATGQYTTRSLAPMYGVSFQQVAKIVGGQYFKRG